MPFGGQPFGATPFAADGFTSPNATVTVATLTVSATLPALSVSAAALASASEQPAIASQPTPSFTAAATLAAPAQATTASLPAATVSAGSEVEKGEAKSSFLQPTETASAAANAELSALVLTLGVTPPTLVVDTDAEVAVSALSFTTSQPTAAAGADAEVAASVQTPTASQPAATLTAFAVVEVGRLLLGVSAGAVSANAVQTPDQEQEPVRLSGADWPRDVWFPFRQSARVEVDRQLGLFAQPRPEVSAGGTAATGPAARSARFSAGELAVTADGAAGAGALGCDLQLGVRLANAGARVGIPGPLDTDRFFWRCRVFEEVWLLNWSAESDFSGLTDAESELMLLEGGRRCST